MNKGMRKSRETKLCLSYPASRTYCGTTWTRAMLGQREDARINHNRGLDALRSHPTEASLRVLAFGIS